MTVQRASIQTHRAAIAEPFGRELLVRRFGEHGAAMIIGAAGVYRSGKHKGQPRGFMHWKKCVVGGWTHEGYGGHVQRPGSYGYGFDLNYQPYRDEPCVPDRQQAPACLTDEQWEDRLVRMINGHTGSKIGENNQLQEGA